MKNIEERAFEYPALYFSANQSSTDLQIRFLKIIKLEYLLLIIASFVSMPYFESNLAHYVYAILFLILTFILIFKIFDRPDQGWYRNRALAESVKTMSWRYCMCASPFNGRNEKADREEFRRFLGDILRGSKSVGGNLSPNSAADGQITASMDALRQESLSNRRRAYARFRIKEQRNWYKSKALYNKNRGNLWVGISIFVYIFAIFLVFGRFSFPEWKFWPFEPIVVFAVSIVGWMQIKKFSELSSAYTLTAHEIGILETKISEVATEEDFSEFVNDAELAFSREHTQWVARQEAR